MNVFCILLHLKKENNVNLPAFTPHHAVLHGGMFVLHVVKEKWEK